MLFHLYVPRAEAIASKTIIPGSAIVAPADGAPADDRVLVDYEGNAFGAENLRDYPTRVLVAAGRSRDRAPTTARMLVPADELAMVGTFDLSRQMFVEVSDRERLSEWLGEETPPVAGQRWEPCHAG